MKHNLFRSLKGMNLVIITALTLSFTFQGSGVIGARAISPDFNKGGPSTPGVTPEISTGTATQQEKQSDPFHPVIKESFVRLANLVNASAGNSLGALDISYLKKLDSHLQDLVSAKLGGENVMATAKANGLRISASQTVLMDVYVNNSLDQAASQLKNMGMQVLATNDSLGNVVEGYLPVDSVLPAASLDFTNALLAEIGCSVDTGSITSQGDGAHNGPAARALGPTGTGVKVGIISDSMNEVGAGLSGSQTTSDLPGSVNVLSDNPSGTDEGRAMGEVIYDTAPGITSMYFSTGTASGPAGKAASINNLVAHGVNIIADDTYCPDEPFFQDGQVTQAVDHAYNAGVAYFASAGNRASQSYESNFRNLGGLHDFDPDIFGTDVFPTVTTVPAGGSIRIVLQWDDQWGNVTHDFDLYLGNVVDDTHLLASGGSVNTITGIPVETVFWKNTTPSPITVRLQISLQAGSNTSFLKYIVDDDFGPITITEWNTNSQTINPDAASAKGAMAVAAINWAETGLNDPESYSSRGPSIKRLFDTNGIRLGSPIIRPKPDIAGADCVATSNHFSGGVGFEGGSFCGTSAAVASAAGVAALVISDKPGIAPSILYTTLRNIANTIDCTLAGNPDADCGYGFLMAAQAVNWANANVNSITSTIAGVDRGTYQLFSSGSVRVNYAGVDSGPVMIHNSIVTPIIAAERDAWAANGTTTSFAQLMGLPSSQLSDTYVFPAYNNVTLNEQLRIGNVDSVPTTVTVTIGGVLKGTYPLAASQAVRVNYAGVDSGPVIVQGTAGVHIIAAERDAWAANGLTTSFVQLMGLPASQLSDTYVFPAYNNVTLNEQLRIGNVDTVPTSVTVTIGGVLKGTYPLAANESVRVNYAGVDSGPVIVQGTAGVHIVAAERDAWTAGAPYNTTTSFAQLMGLPSSQLSDTYLFPAYNNVTLNEQLRIGNVDTVPTTVTVTIGGVLQGNYPLAANEAVRVNYAGLDSGPVVIQGTTGVHIIAAERDAWAVGTSFTSFIQLMGLPTSQLSDTFLFPAYNNVTLNEQLRFAVP